jgi:anti-anti-sigma factor
VSAPGDTASLIDRIETLVRSGAANFVLDVQLLSSVDSATLGELVRAQEIVRAHHGRVVLVKVGARLRRYLATTGLLRYFELAVSEAAALSLLAE